MKKTIAALLAILIASSTFAQPAPPPPGEGGDRQQRDGQGPEGRGDRQNRGDRGPRGEGPRPPGAPDRPPQPPLPPMSDRMQHVEMLRGYLELVDRFSRLASNPTNSGVAAVITATEMLKARGNDAAIEYFTKVMPDVKDASVQRAIRIQLVDLYKNSGQQDKALAELRSLMTESPGSPSGKPGQ